MYKLIFASNNQHKLEEIQAATGNEFQIISLAETGITEDIPEPGVTLEENALLKARYVYERMGLDCFADDTGLEVQCLNNEPGVYSARYAGEQKNADDNMNLLLHKMKGETNRSASFRTVIALIIAGKEYYFDGEVAGSILTQKSGTKGFGYDPIFKPDGHEKCFAEMSMEEKNAISHRARALKKLIDFLRNSHFCTK